MASQPAEENGIACLKNQPELISAACQTAGGFFRRCGKRKR
ncbi:hypothetical protein [Clostridium sp. BNL1100]|nr:hypothetical protein [Clostridium sp. BNL1100]